MQTPQYVLLTAAKNEEDFIALTLESVISQTILPGQWVIVSDGSTDRTDEIVRSYAARFPFIELLRLEKGSKRTFSSKARAIKAAQGRIRVANYHYVGILDADVSFEPFYYEGIIQKFEQTQRLGVAGGLLFDRQGHKYVKQITSTEWSVSGPVQMFRRECFEQIGGYVPVRSGVDAIAEIMARMHGWTVRAFPELKVLHHRNTGSQTSGLFKRPFRSGQEAYSLGYHPLFLLTKSLSRFVQKPYILGSILMLCGYGWNCVSGKGHDVSQEFVEYLRTEQMTRLSSIFLLHRQNER